MPDTIFEIIWLAGFIAASAIRVLFTVRNRNNRAAGERQTVREGLVMLPPLVGMIIIPLLYVFNSWPDFADYRLPVWAGWGGAALFAFSLWLLWRSHADLGRDWLPTVQLREGHSLVTRGVFRYIRHPMYAAHWLWGLCQPLLLQNWIAGFAMLVSLLPTYLVRMPQEERMMLEQFGEEYRAYMGRTGRVIPRLRR